MAYTSENFRGLHKKYQTAMEKASIVLNPEYNNGTTNNSMVELYAETSSLSEKLRGASKNTKTPSISKRYGREADDMEFYNNEIEKRLKEDC